MLRKFSRLFRLSFILVSFSKKPRIAIEIHSQHLLLWYLEDQTHTITYWLIQQAKEYTDFVLFFMIHIHTVTQ